MKTKTKITLFLLLVFSVILIVLFQFEKETEPIELKIEEEKEEETYTLLFAGDVMLNRGVSYMTEKHGQDYTFPFLKIKETLWGADLLFANLESMISDKGKDAGSLYSFRADPKAIDALLYAGFDVVSLANNHTFDYGREALEDTMIRLKDAQIAYTGAGFDEKEAHSVTIIDLDSLKVGFLGYTEFLYPYAYASDKRSGITLFDEEKMKEDIEKAKEETDFLVVTFHYGDEYQKEPNEKQRLWSKKAIDYGADIIIGHHPHVTQPIEKYKGKYIAYSLGNFVFDQYFSEETMSGFLFEIEIKGKEIIGARKMHYKLNEYYQPELVEIETLN